MAADPGQSAQATPAPPLACVSSDGKVPLTAQDDGRGLQHQCVEGRPDFQHILLAMDPPSRNPADTVRPEVAAADTASGQPTASEHPTHRCCGWCAPAQP